MKFEIDNPKAKAVLEELAFRLHVSEEEIIKAALNELVKQYVSKPTLATMYVKTVLKKQRSV